MPMRGLYASFISYIEAPGPEPVDSTDSAISFAEKSLGVLWHLQHASLPKPHICN